MSKAGISVSPLSIIEPPICGWEQLTAENHSDFSSKIPSVMPGKIDATSLIEEYCFCINAGLLYIYLAERMENSQQSGTFRALKRGYILWCSGCLDSIEFNCNNPTYCRIRCKATPSMRSGIYNVYILLKREGRLADTISRATCQCAAG